MKTPDARVSARNTLVMPLKIELIIRSLQPCFDFNLQMWVSMYLRSSNFTSEAGTTHCLYKANLCHAPEHIRKTIPMKRGLTSAELTDLHLMGIQSCCNTTHCGSFPSLTSDPCKLPSSSIGEDQCLTLFLSRHQPTSESRKKQAIDAQELRMRALKSACNANRASGGAAQPHILRHDARVVQPTYRTTSTNSSHEKLDLHVLIV